MANGGIIGPPNAVTPASCTPISENVTQITSTGCFTVQCAPLGGNRPGAVLVVGGGGSRGGSGGGRPGGGGAGGFRLLSCETFSSCAIPVVIGAGGSCSSGTNTVFGNPLNPISATGGGGGNPIPGPANPGGSGGGGGGFSNIVGGSGNAGGYSPPEGNPGGTGNQSPSTWRGGGGGGASAAGNPNGGSGGAGSPVTSVFGAAPQPYYLPNTPNTGATACGVFAGGGGGGGCGPGVTVPGGVGGGGNGFLSNSCGTLGHSGATNSGGGGGGAYNLPACGGQGGSGIVLVKENATCISIPAKAPGVWNMNEVYENVKDGNWTNA